MPLLFDAGKLGVPLVDDQIHQRVAHLLRGHLSQVLPLAPAFECAKLDLVGLDRAIEGIELEASNLAVVDADLLAPVVKHADPIAKGSDFGYFSWHGSNLQPERTASLSSSKAGAAGLPFHFPLNSAGRFSTYAFSPSFASSLWNNNC